MSPVYVVLCLEYMHFNIKNIENRIVLWMANEWHLIYGSSLQFARTSNIFENHCTANCLVVRSEIYNMHCSKQSKSKKKITSENADWARLILWTKAIQRFSMENLHISNENTSIVHRKMAQQKGSTSEFFQWIFIWIWHTLTIPFSSVLCIFLLLFLLPLFTASWCVIFVIFTVHVYFLWQNNSNFI